MAYTTADNNYATARFIVGASGQANYTTIASALTAASSGNTIFILPGTYTENLTLKAGVNLVAYSADALTPNVTIVGKATFTAAGTVSISGIRLQTNSDFYLVVSGSNASIVNLNNCYLIATNNTGISFTASNTSASINVQNSVADLTTTGIAYWSMSSTGVLSSTYSYWNNSGLSTTASSNSAGAVSPTNSAFGGALATSSAGIINSVNTIFNSNGINTAAVTTAGTGTSIFINCSFLSGTASAISIGSGTAVSLSQATVSSTNTNAITGAGTLNYGNIDWFGTSRLINTTTQTSLNGGSFTPVLNFGGGTTGITYTTQIGNYVRYNDVVFISITIVLSNKGSSTGVATITGLPFTSKNDASSYDMPMVAVTLTAAAQTYVFAELPGNSSTLTLDSIVVATGSAANLADTNFNNTTNLRIQGYYFI